MIIEKVSPWDFEKTVELLTSAAEKMDWMIPAIHDLQQSLAKAGQTVKPVKVLEICKPAYSGKMLEKSDERIVSVIMPCRISVYLKDDHKTYVATLNANELTSGMQENIREVLVAASSEIDRIIDSVI